MRTVSILMILVIIPCVFFILLHKAIKCLKYVRNVFAEIVVPQTISLINGEREKDELMNLSESQKKIILNNPFFGYSGYRGSGDLEEDLEDQGKKKKNFSSKLVLIVCGITINTDTKILIGILSIVKLMYFKKITNSLKIHQTKPFKKTKQVAHPLLV